MAAIKRSYDDYVKVVSAYGIGPIPQGTWEEWQERLPEPKGIVMPSTLNYAIAVAIEAGDLGGAAQLIGQCDEHDQDAWLEYTEEGSHFPAGGLWFNQLDWMNGVRLDACPMTVAHMLDFNGELPAAMKDYLQWEADVTEAVATELEASYSDAAGVVEAQNSTLQQSWAQSDTAEQAAKKICAAGTCS